MWWRAQTTGQRIAFVGLMGIAVILGVLRISSLLSSDVGLALVPVYLLAYLFAIVALPLILFTLLNFVYSMFVRPYLRLLRMRRYLSNKELREAARRSP